MTSILKSHQTDYGSATIIPLSSRGKGDTDNKGKQNCLKLINFIRLDTFNEWFGIVWSYLCYLLSVKNKLYKKPHPWRIRRHIFDLHRNRTIGKIFTNCQFLFSISNEDNSKQEFYRAAKLPGFYSIHITTWNYELIFCRFS